MNGRVVTGDWWLDGESNISMHAWFSSRRAFVNNQFWDHFQHQWIWGEKNIRRGGIFKGSEPNRTKEDPSLLTALMCNTFNYCIPFARSSTLRPLKDPSSGNYIIIWLLCLGAEEEKNQQTVSSSATHTRSRPCRVDCTDIPQHHPRLNWFCKVPSSQAGSSADSILHMTNQNKYWVPTSCPSFFLCCTPSIAPAARLLTCHLSIVVVNNKIQETLSRAIPNSSFVLLSDLVSCPFCCV